MSSDLPGAAQLLGAKSRLQPELEFLLVPLRPECDGKSYMGWSPGNGGAWGK